MRLFLWLAWRGFWNVGWQGLPFILFLVGMTIGTVYSWPLNTTDDRVAGWVVVWSLGSIFALGVTFTVWPWLTEASRDWIACQKRVYERKIENAPTRKEHDDLLRPV